MSSEKVVVFQCGNEEYAVPIEHVVSIEKLEQVNPIPHLPNYLIGLMKIRGELMPIIDFEEILYHRSGVNFENARVVTMHTQDMSLGILVKEAKEILDIATEDLKQIGLVNYTKTQYFTAVANLENRMITIVDPSILVRSLEGIKDIQSYLENMKKEEIGSL
ncbi:MULTISPECIES: chemotaxis protein CheW [Psychrobacillus]|uniref:Chemotaxis protein CheW n=1 Tax=Psychrobacillus lasiicapitis TaxID=1636719 RepID=A0A544SWQ9_9BACI|nr:MULTISPECIES: chemotaxis protein CheW [Psychrobacillus]MDI2588716.1 chemotaxis protein CheW [Psychrobacillus sp. NEAU-3TGS]TQR09597.1 chemotaxis protein CheW [Psychrobacillus lasiicapitis]GGA29144.1 chemotaxis protein CheW [Psychrobacillus lasiicapitis]